MALMLDPMASVLLSYDDLDWLMAKVGNLDARLKLNPAGMGLS